MSHDSQTTSTINNNNYASKPITDTYKSLTKTEMILLKEDLQDLMLDSVRSSHHATFLRTCQEQQLMPTGLKIHKPPVVMAIDDTFRKQHDEIPRKAERDLLDLALEHVNALNEQYDDDILDVMNELDTKLSDKEHKKFNDKADSLQKKLEKRARKLNLLQKNKNNPTNNKKSANIKTNIKTNTNSTKKQTTTKPTVVKSASTGTFPRSGKNTSNNSKKTSYNNNNNNQIHKNDPIRNPRPKTAEKGTTPSEITRDGTRTVSDNGKRVTFSINKDNDNCTHQYFLDTAAGYHPVPIPNTLPPWVPIPYRPMSQYYPAIPTQPMIPATTNLPPIEHPYGLTTGHMPAGPGINTAYAGHLWGPRW